MATMKLKKKKNSALFQIPEDAKRQRYFLLKVYKNQILEI